MSTVFKVLWTISPLNAPQPWLPCSGCGGPRAFRCSGKIRLNANGRRLDAWLIYRCVACDSTWNRPLFERRALRSIEPALLEAMQRNDPGWIRSQAFDIEALRRKTRRIDEFAELDIAKAIIDAPPAWDQLEIRLAVPLPVGMRLDRLLAGALPVSRAGLVAMHDKGQLIAIPGDADMMRRRVRDGMRIVFDLAAVADRHASWAAVASGV